MTQQASASPKFGTFTGVFTPTLLTILGVILFVRVGWVVGNAGLAGASLILGLAILITTCTGLSLSSIATNTRIGHGGPYAILNRSLGLEVGGSIGIPLYLTRPLGVAMYIFGFREGLSWIFPQLPSIAVDLGIFALLFGIAYKSANLAFKTQYFIMGIIVLSLFSIFASPLPFKEPVEIQWWGDYTGMPETGFQGTNFWGVFAVFFPATTGILAGANMSGDLKDPRRAIPIGTLAAIALSSVIYFAVAFWCARTGTLETLSQNYNHVIDNALFPPLVVAGLLGATASSALAGLVGGPRLLMAMGQNRIIPYSETMASMSHGEPRNALMVTGGLTILCILMRDLNNIAAIVTMFFLITYCMINVVVLIESGLGLVSYRPTMKVPMIVPTVGLLGCLFSMFIVNPVFSLVAVATVFVIYAFIARRMGREHDGEDVRSSIFVAFAEWAAGRVTPEDLGNVRAWKPHLLVPTDDPVRLRGNFHLILDLARPEGSVKLLGLTEADTVLEDFQHQLEHVGQAMRERGVLTSWAVVSQTDYVNSVGASMMALQGAFFRPNLLFLRVPSEPALRQVTVEVARIAMKIKNGVVLYSEHPSAGLGQKQDIQLWIRPGRDGWDPHAAFDTANLNLILLMGYRLNRVWKGRLTLVTLVKKEEDQPQAMQFLNQLCDLARLPGEVRRLTPVGDLETGVRSSPTADISIFGLNREAPDLAWAEHMTQLTKSSCLFVLDSGRESARA